MANTIIVAYISFLRTKSGQYKKFVLKEGDNLRLVLVAGVVLLHILDGEVPVAEGQLSTN